ncbi:heme lyase NrfEFG subunit NrfF [Enterobacteriaceae bacterium BIT-l23]|uniref:heme lyase NrfEFG subunit NrfF n=1 Tax=Jejubacter sp. L23 TaxID=3092086 RepID=UPI001585AAC5|nr:heme lyase NrfEFG subunit NrfF [Enterobacteriaceae bacterium BIT-l23]
MRRLAWSLMLWCLVTTGALAEVVDTWRFSSPEVQDRALAISGRLRCPQCQNQSLLESTAPVAVAMRHQVFAMAEQGKSEQEITGYMTERYGDFVRYQPPWRGAALVLWLFPPLLLVALAVALWRYHRRRQ